RGVKVRAMTSSIFYSGQSKSYAADFDPALVEAWVGQAGAVVSAQTPPASDKVRGLGTPALISAEGSEITLYRKRKHDGWDPQVLIIFSSVDDKHSWAIGAKPAEAQQFLQDLLVEEARSTLVLDSLNLGSRAICSMSVDEPPEMLSHPTLLYPPSLRNTGAQSEVWLTYVVGTDGKAEPDSYEVMMFDDSRFVDEAIKVVSGAKFRPGMQSGQPVRTLVNQPVIFRTN
ncbi:MAG TPA: energy transducer TonB, partial [Gemmatimonadales bacterium]|nr:energy transducer TonB [Gemmatimonadales bacterium]